jgi:transcriptional regulator with XRE-family HTH domain
VLTPGQRLRVLREEFGLTVRDVETASTRLAAKHNNEDFAIGISRLSDIETKSVVPSVFRLYSLSVIYRRDMRELLAWYGVDLDRTASDLKVIEPPKSHRAEALAATTAVEVPVRLDPGLDHGRR